MAITEAGTWLRARQVHVTVRLARWRDSLLELRVCLVLALVQYASITFRICASSSRAAVPKGESGHHSGGFRERRALVAVKGFKSRSRG